MKIFRLFLTSLVLALTVILMLVDVSASQKSGLSEFEKKKTFYLNDSKDLKLLDDERYVYKSTHIKNKMGVQRNDCVLDSLVYFTSTRISTRKTKYTYTYDPGGKIKTETYEFWETSIYGDTLYHGYRDSFTYDERGNILTSFNELWDTDLEQWRVSSRGTNTYDDFGNQLMFFRESWDSDLEQWINEYRSIHEYDENGNPLLYFSEDWDDDSGQWINNYRTTFMYDESENKTIRLDEAWFLDYSQWISTYRSTYIHDDDGNVLISLSEQWYLDELRWVPRSRNVSTYDEMGNQLTRVWERWHPDFEEFVFYRRWTFTYGDHGNEIANFVENWDLELNQWVHTYRSNKTYNEYGNILLYSAENWHFDEERWINSDRDTYTYDDNGNLTHFIAERWDGTAWVRDSGYCEVPDFRSFTCEELFAYYSPITKVDNRKSKRIEHISLAQNYPNPFNPSTQISYDLSKASNVFLIVFDVNGREVTTLVNELKSAGHHSVTWDGHDAFGNLLPTGVYFYKLTAGNFIDAKKMVFVQ